MTFPGSHNEGDAARLTFQTDRETPLVGETPGVMARSDDPGRALDTARTRDRLDWEDRCSTVQRRINRAYDLELNGKRVRQVAWLVMRWCLVVLVSSCFMTWTGQIAMILFGLSLGIGILSLVGLLLGGLVELVAELRLCLLLARGEQDHLEVYDPAARTER